MKEKRPISPIRYIGRINGLMQSVIATHRERSSELREKMGHIDATMSFQQLYDLAITVASVEQKAVIDALKDRLPEPGSIAVLQGEFNAEVEHGTDEGVAFSAPNKVQRLLEPFDLMPNASTRKSRRRMITWLSILGVVGVLFLLFYIFSSPWAVEMRLYNEIKKCNDPFELSMLIEEYRLEFPEGKHINEIDAEEERMYYLDIKENPSMYSISEYEDKYPEGRYMEEICYIEATEFDEFSGMVRYMESYPDGEYIDEVEAEYNEKWNSIIEGAVSQYDASSEEEKAFAGGLCEYMRDNRIATIRVEYTTDKKFKNFSELSAETRNQYNDIYFSYTHRFDKEQVEQVSDDQISGYVSAEINDYVRSGFDEMTLYMFDPVLCESERAVDRDPVVIIDLKYSNTYQPVGGVRLPEMVMFSYIQLPSSLTIHKFILNMKMEYTVTMSYPGCEKELKYSGMLNLREYADVDVRSRINTDAPYRIFVKEVVRNGLNDLFEGLL